MHIASADRPVTLYNLEVIISVGYRVNSVKGVRFRQWATQVLRQYLVQGYVLNEKRPPAGRPEAAGAAASRSSCQPGAKRRPVECAAAPGRRLCPCARRARPV
ncbi:RhuM family protein [Hymenobacter sp. BRD67]|uniref:RhuM family protein n=1 Tax=Hymenobacter sp. BRD67 TaxID=2675877 RepID=UPI0020B80171|nr:RhuM family protein [Hymenobacter sp. BRD67]